MKRPAHPRSHALLGLNINLQTGLYELSELDIAYSMPLETTRLLKQQFQNNANGRVFEWYRHLDKGTKATVTRTGRIEIIGDDFYPDLEVE